MPDSTPLAQAVPLSFSQETFWFDPTFPVHDEVANIRLAACDLEGPLDTSALEAALNAMAETHNAWRLRFLTVGGEPCMAADAAPIRVEARDVQGLSVEQCRSLFGAEHEAHFEVGGADPLVRATVFRRAPEKHTLFLTAHHLVCDAGSTPMVHASLDANYAAAVEGRLPPANAVKRQPAYGEYAEDERRAWASSSKNHVAFWRKYLEGAPHGVTLKDVRPDPGRRFVGEDVALPLEDAVLERIQAVSRTLGTTPFAIAMAALAAVIGASSGRSESVLRYFMDSRPPTHEKTIGCFLNWVLVRARHADGDTTLRALVDRIGREVRLTHEYAAPFHPMMGELRRRMNAPQGDELMVVLNFLNLGRRPLIINRLGDLRVTFLGPEEHFNPPGATRFDLVFRVLFGQEGAGMLHVTYNKESIPKVLAERLTASFRNVLVAGSADPTRLVRDLL